MAALIQDVEFERDVIIERRRLGLDRFDEVWDGTYVMNPLPNIEHQELVMHIGIVLAESLWGSEKAIVCPGVNVSDRQTGWKKNYRCPDVAVFLADTRAINCDTHWMGGPDFAVEIITPRDRSREKLAFYAKVGTRELLLVDRKPWSLELYRHDGESLTRVGKSTVTKPEWLASEVAPLKWRLVRGKSRPEIEVAQRGSRQKWRF